MKSVIQNEGIYVFTRTAACNAVNKSLLTNAPALQSSIKRYTNDNMYKEAIIKVKIDKVNEDITVIGYTGTNIISLSYHKLTSHNFFAFYDPKTSKAYIIRLSDFYPVWDSMIVRVKTGVDGYGMGTTVSNVDVEKLKTIAYLVVDGSDSITRDYIESYNKLFNKNMF